MRAYSLLLIGALFIGGCHVNIEEPKTATTTTPPATQTPSTTTTTAGATTGTTTATTTGKPAASTEVRPTTAPTIDVAADEKKPGYNPNRTYQLFNLKTANLTINGQTLKCYIMDTDTKREEGFMFVKDSQIAPNEGMIFPFTSEKEQAFWMHNTIAPLDIAYIDSKKVVVSVAHMKALDETSVKSAKPAQYVLEMKAGTIERLGIKAGTKVDIPASVKAVE